MSHARFQSCIEACDRCADACDTCASGCLGEPDVAGLAECIRVDLDCAALCRLAAGAMARGSEFAHEICELCAEVCAACATECGRHAQHHDHCRACAEACRRCEDECRRMVGTTSMRADVPAGRGAANAG